MKRSLRPVAALLAISLAAYAQQPAPTDIHGFRDSSAEHKVESTFLAVPDATLAGEHLKTLTAEPHIAGSPEDRKTAEYVAKKFREAGLDTRIDEYKVWMNYPKSISVDATAPEGLKMHGPTPEHVEGDPLPDDPRVVMPFNGGSPSGDVEADIVYANYGRPEDFKRLKQLGVDVKGKIVLVRYGQNFRGVKALVAQENGAAGVLIYSDPMDDGYFKGDMYPKGPYRPMTGVQRGSVQFMFEYPGDPTTPEFASVPDLSESKRLPLEQVRSLPKVPATPISPADAAPLLQALGGPDSPREWQGALPFTYHVGPGPVKVHMKLEQDYRYVSIWNVIGTVKGKEKPEEMVVAGNHRDAWVYGAVDPNSGTAAMLEAVHGVGALLKTGWRPKRTIVFASWDAEEEGLIGSTEYAEQNAKQLQNAVAYFNMDVAVSGPNFGASSVPSLKQFMRDVAKGVPSPDGGSVYDVWRTKTEQNRKRQDNTEISGMPRRTGAADQGDVNVGDLGSGSDYSSFIQHLGIPAADIGSGGPYGVYHSAFDNYNWFTKFADPKFVYLQQMARVFGLMALRMSSSDELPFDYTTYGKDVRRYVETSQQKAEALGMKDKLDFAPALHGADRLAAAGQQAATAAPKLSGAKLDALNAALRDAERSMLGTGLPHRPWFRHVIYAPGEYTGYAAVVIPGVNEAMDRNDFAGAGDALAEVTAALNRAADRLEKVSK